MKIPNEIEKLVPYAPGKPIAETQREYGLERVIKLASNENLLGTSPAVAKAIESLGEEIHRYPDGACYQLRQALSSFLNVAGERLIFGNGSNEIVDLLIRTFCRGDDRVLTSQAAFIAYKIGAQSMGFGCDEVPLGEAYKFDVQGFISAWTPRHRLIFLANPNNPTGTYLTRDQLQPLVDFLRGKDCLLVLDEAYLEYVRAQDYGGGEAWLEQEDHVMVLRTFSKVYGIAALRLGYALGPAKLMDYINRVRNPFNINSLAQVAGEAALSDQNFVQRTCQATWEGLEFWQQNLNQLGLSYCPSQTNFVFFDTGLDSAQVFTALLRQGIIMRPLKGYGFPRHLRVTVGTHEENQLALRALTAAVHSGRGEA